MASDEALRDLPKFSSPPVVEVAIAVEFVPNPKLGVIRMSRLTELWADELPKVQEQPALPASVPPDGFVLTGLGLQIGPPSGFIRLWMLSEDEHLLLQLQQDRLIVNWRRLDDGPYPSYTHLRDQFLAYWRTFTDAIEDLGRPQPTIAEVTFVNVIPSGGDEPDLATVLTCAKNAELPGVPKAARVQFESAVLNELGQGQLIVSAEHVAGNASSVTLVTRIGLTGETKNDDDLMSALDFAHETGVVGFTNITTDEQHLVWGRTQ